MMAQTAENASCVEGQKQEKHVGAHVTLSCERLFSLSDADSLQGLGNLPAVNSALLKDFEEHQLLEQVRGMHGLGAGPLKRGVPPAQLAALIPLLQAQVDQSTVILPPAEELQTDIVLRADGRVASMEEHLLVKRVTPGGGVESGAVQAGKNGSRIDPDAKDSRKAQRKCLPAQPVSSQSEPQSAVGQVLSGRKGNHKFSARDEGAAVDRNAPRKQPSGIERVRLASTPFKTAENSEPTRAATTPHLPALCSEKEHLKAIAPQKQVDPASSSRPSHDMTKPNLVTAPRTPTATEPPKLTPTESLTPQQLEAATLRAARQLIAALQFMVSSARLGHPLSVSLMLKAHAILMDGLCSHPGEFRRTGCKAGDGFRYPPPKEVPWRMRRWVAESNRVLAHPSLPPWTKAAHILLVFVHEIHPFQDGNGRMCRLLMNFVLTQEGLPFTVLLTRGGNNRARYVRAIKESYATGSCAPMVRRVLYAIDEAGRALERFRGAGNEPVEGPGKSTRFRGACEEESEGRDELDRLEGPCEKRCQGDGVQPASKGVGREARELVRGAQEERGATAGGAECRSTGSEEEKIGGSLPGKNAMGQKEVSTKPVNEVRKTTAREDACTAGQQLLSGRLERQSVCRASESQRAGSADHQIANERSTGAVPNPGSAAVVSACNRAVSDDLLRPESRTAAVRTEDVSQQRPEAPPCPAVLPSARALHACPEDGEGRQSEPCGRPFLDEVPEANGRQVYGEKEGRKRGRSPSVTSSSSGGGSAGDAGSDDTGTSEGSEGGGQGPGGNGGGGGGDSEDTGSDDTAPEDADTGTEEGSSSEEDTAQASSGTDVAPSGGTDTGSSGSDTQSPVADGSSDSDSAPVHESDTGSSEEEGHPVDGSESASVSDTGGTDSETQPGPSDSDSDTAPHPSDSDTAAVPYPSDSDTAPHPSDSDTAAVPYPSDSDTVGTDHPDTGTEDVGTDEGSYSDENGGGGSSADWSASGGSDDGTDDDAEGGGEWPEPAAAPTPPAPAPSVHIELVAADDEVPKEGDDANTCTICMERKKNGVVIPCGHVFCRRCAEQLRAERGKCAICNSDILGAYKLYGD